MKKYLEIGKIVTTHGIKGEVRIQPWCDSPQLFCEFESFYLDENGKTEVEVESSRVHKNVIVAKLSGCDTVEEAAKLRNKIVYIDRDWLELEENTYFIQDLIGMTVIDADNKDIVYGKLTDVTQAGANDVYYIKNQQGKEYLIPAIADVVIKTDTDNMIMEIRPLKGLFDDEN